MTSQKKKFAFDVGWVFAGSMFLLILRFLQKPVMARYLGPAGLGLYAMASMVVSTVELVASFGVPSAVVKYIAECKDKKNELYPLVSSAFITMAAFGIISSIVLFLLSDTLAEIFDMPSLSFLLKLYAFVFPFSLAYTIVISFFNGMREMKYYTLIDISKGILTFSFVVLLLVLGFGVKGAVTGSVLAIIVGVTIATGFMKKFIHFTVANYKKSTKMLTSFGSKLMLANAVNVINYQADILMIGYFLTATDVGYYSVAVSLSRFFWVLPQSIQKISYPAASEYWAKNEIRSLNNMIDKSMKHSALILLIVGLGVWFFVKDIIILLFGQSFAPSVLPFQILLVGTVIFGIVKSIGGTLPAISHPDLSLKINATGAIVNILLNISLIQLFGIAGAAVATITSLIIVAIFNIYFIIKLSNIYIDTKWYISAFIITLLAIAVFSTGSEWINTYVLGTAILGAYITILFLLFLTKEDREMLKKAIHPVISRNLK